MNEISNERLFLVIYIYSTEFASFCINTFTPPLISFHTRESRVVKIHSTEFIFILFFSFFLFVVAAILFHLALNSRAEFSCLILFI